MRAHYVLAFLVLCMTAWAKVILPRLSILSGISLVEKSSGTNINSCPTEQPALDTMLELRGGKTTTSTLPSVLRRTLRSAKLLISSILPKFILKRMGYAKSYAKSKGKSFGRKAKQPLKPSKSLPKHGTGSVNRVEKELQEFIKDPPENCRILSGSNLRNWVVELKGVNGTIYEGEAFRLKLAFPKEYPAKPPSAYFLKPCPKHVHVYTNGDICLNLLGRDWRPTMSAQLLVASILSMLSSAREKRIPQDNALHADSSPGRQQNWIYHDDKC